MAQYTVVICFYLQRMCKSAQPLAIEMHLCYSTVSQSNTVFYCNFLCHLTVKWAKNPNHDTKFIVQTKKEREQCKAESGDDGGT